MDETSTGQHWSRATVVEQVGEELVLLGDDGVRRRVPVELEGQVRSLRAGQRVELGDGGGVRLVRTPVVVHHPA